MLQQTDVYDAARYLGYNYSLRGAVVSGNRLGRTMGFPTANMQLYDPLKVVPGDGVYGVYVTVLGRRYMGITNIGVRPTVAAHGERTIETNILGFDEDIYGLDITVEFVFKIRDEIKFASVNELQSELERNKALAAENIEQIAFGEDLSEDGRLLTVVTTATLVLPPTTFSAFTT